MRKRKSKPDPHGEALAEIARLLKELIAKAQPIHYFPVIVLGGQGDDPPPAGATVLRGPMMPNPQYGATAYTTGSAYSTTYHVGGGPRIQ